MVDFLCYQVFQLTEQVRKLENSHSRLNEGLSRLSSDVLKIKFESDGIPELVRIRNLIPTDSEKIRDTLQDLADVPDALEYLQSKIDRLEKKICDLFNAQSTRDERINSLEVKLRNQPSISLIPDNDHPSITLNLDNDHDYFVLNNNSIILNETN